MVYFGAVQTSTASSRKPGDLFVATGQVASNGDCPDDLTVSHRNHPALECGELGIVVVRERSRSGLHLSLEGDCVSTHHGSRVRLPDGEAKHALGGAVRAGAGDQVSVIVDYHRGRWAAHRPPPGRARWQWRAEPDRG
jgi:hypothetical protein